jgi:tetratricopeptide (TPR) repeat protein
MMKATKYLSRALLKNPMYVESRIILGNTMKSQNLLECAIGHFKVAVLIQPNHIGQSLAFTEYEHKRYESAMTHLEMLIALNPLNSQARRLLRTIIKCDAKNSEWQKTSNTAKIEELVQIENEKKFMSALIGLRVLNCNFQAALQKKPLLGYYMCGMKQLRSWEGDNIFLNEICFGNVKRERALMKMVTMKLCFE